MTLKAFAIPRVLRARGLPVAIVVYVGLVAGLALWEPLEIYERSHVARTTHQALTSLRDDLESDMQARLFAQVRLAELWSARVLASENQWELSSRLFLDHHPGYVTLEWADATCRVLCAVGRHGEVGRRDRVPGTEQALNDFRARQPQPAAGVAVLTARFPLPDGRTGVRVIVPVARREATVGYLVAVVDLAQTFDSMASDHKGLGYSVSVTDGTTEIYRMPGSEATNETTLAEAGVMRLPGLAFNVRIWPKPEILTVMRSSMPAVAMVLGGLLGAVGVIAVYFGRTARHTSKKLQCALDGLEERVKQRTIELKQLSETLQGEVSDRRRAEDSYRDLSGRLLRLQDEERRRFARELHDSTAQVLGALAINVDRALHLARAGDLQRVTQVLGESGKIVDEVTQEIRTVSHLLHPPMLDDLGMEYVLPWYAGRFGQRSGIAVTLDLQPNLGRFPRDTELTLFRILQEALANVHRHSGSPSVSIMLARTATAVTLVIRDRGKGVPKGALDPVARTAAGSPPIGIGIAGMRGRVNQLKGTLDITGDSHGTTVRAVLPVDPAADADPGPGVDEQPVIEPDSPLRRSRSVA